MIDCPHMKLSSSFNSSFGPKLQIPAVIQEVKRFITESPEHSYKVIIGTDSLGTSDKMADFVTAIVVHRVGHGGRYFWRRVKMGKFHTLRDRIIQEVVTSLDLAKDVLTGLKLADVSNWDFEIHADIGKNGETKALIQEVVGMIRANDFEAKMKPHSYAASTVADRHV